MTELGRTTALNALLGQILHPRSGSSIGTPMQMDEHGWMKLSAEPALPRPTDYLGSDTGAAMDLLRHVADERLAISRKQRLLEVRGRPKLKEAPVRADGRARRGDGAGSVAAGCGRPAGEAPSAGRISCGCLCPRP